MTTQPPMREMHRAQPGPICLGWVRFVITASIVVMAIGSFSPAKAAERFEFHSYKDVEDLFERIGYTPQAWKSGIREVPRLYVTHVPNRWRQRFSKEVTVKLKKRLFFRMLGPIVLRSNELILEDRSKLRAIAARSADGNRLDRQQLDWLKTLAARYKVKQAIDGPQRRVALDQLLERVDIVPPSLALAQSAEESGWGTSRFADLGNALFGQWTWGGKGIKPKAQRAEHGDHRIAAFESPLGSVSAYMRNLNTHPAYKSLRQKRAELRQSGERVSGYILAGTLVNYSERGAAYVKSLRAIMRVNRLAPADEARLSNQPPIHMVPVGPGARLDRFYG